MKYLVRIASFNLNLFQIEEILDSAEISYIREFYNDLGYYRCKVYADSKEFLTMLKLKFASDADIRIL